MSFKFSGSKLQQLLRDMGDADLQVLKSELLLAVEEVAKDISPASIQPGEAAVEAVLNPVMQQAFEKLIDGVKL